MISEKSLVTDGTSTIYSVGFEIISEDHCNVLLGTVLQSSDTYDVINNAVVFHTAPTSGQDLMIRVCTTESDLAASPTDIGIVATSITNVNQVANNIANVLAVDANSANVTIVSTNIAGVNTVATDIANVNAAVANKANIDAAVANTTNINSAVANTSNINAAVANETNINLAVANETDIDAAVANEANITAVAVNETNVNIVAGIGPAGLQGIVDNEANINSVGTDIANVNTTATNIADVNTVSANIGAVTTVSSNIAHVQKVSQDLQETISEIETVANDLNETTSEIETVAASVGNVDTVGAAITNVNTVATDIANVNTTATNVANVNTTAASITNVNTVASNVADVNSVAGNITNVNSVADNEANINTAVSELAAINNYADTYASGASAPTTPTLGDLWFDTASQTMKVYGTLGWQNAGSSVNGTENSVEHTATSGQTSFPVTYDPGYVQVFLNGIRLDTTDYTATDGANVVLTSGAGVGDTFFAQSFGTFALADHYSKTDSDARYSQTGDAISLADGVKAQFGDGNDLQIYHSGSNSWIRDTGTGVLVIDTNGSTINLQGSGPSELMARFYKDGPVQLYYNNSRKLVTTSTGIDVTGSVTCDGLTVDGQVSINSDTGTTNDAVNVLNLTATSTNTTANGFGVGLGFFTENSTYSTVNEIGRIEVIETNEPALDDDMVFYNKTNNTLTEKLRLNSTGIDVTGTVAATSFTGDGSGLTGIVSIPTGLISMWSGAASAIPSGWNLCDGNNGTPNLVGKFIKGGSTAGTTGGSNTHSHSHSLSAGSHTLSASQMPSHTHSAQGRNTGSSGNCWGSNLRIWSETWNQNGSCTTYGYTSSGMSNTGSSSSHSHTLAGSIASGSNEPAYYQLCYIMKA